VKDAYEDWPRHWKDARVGHALLPLDQNVIDGFRFGRLSKSSTEVVSSSKALNCIPRIATRRVKHRRG
jgi:hypothetical protein